MAPPCPRPEGGRWQGSLPEGERHWLAALTAATPNGFLALLAVLLQLAVVLNPESSRLGRVRDRHSRLALVAALDCALLIPLQLIFTWGSLNQQASGENKQRLQGLAVIGQLSQSIRRLVSGGPGKGAEAGLA